MFRKLLGSGSLNVVGWDLTILLFILRIEDTSV